MNAPIKPGSRWGSDTCKTEVAVVKPPASPVVLECGGRPMHSPPDAARQAAAEPAPDHAGGSLLGKRYIDVESALEVLCTKPGAGSLSVAGRLLTIKESKALPSSD